MYALVPVQRTALQLPQSPSRGLVSQEPRRQSRPQPRESAPRSAQQAYHLHGAELAAAYYGHMQSALEYGLNRLTGRQQSLADKSGWLVNQVA